MPLPTPVQKYNFIEHYAGCGSMTQCVRESERTAAKLDILYSKGMDICGSGGYALLGRNVHDVFQTCSARGASAPRTHLVSVLRGLPGFTLWAGVQCSTWVAISRPTTMRSQLAPLGNVFLKSVRLGNLQAIRTDWVMLASFPRKFNRACHRK